MSLPGTNVEITFNNVVVNVPVVVGIQTSGLPIDVVVRYGASRLTAVQGVDYTIDWEGNNPALPGADLTHFNITPLSGLLAKIAISGPNVIYVRRELPLVEDFDYDDAFIRQKLVDQFDRTWMVLQQLGFRFGEIGAIVEAPTDGQQYGRQSAGWTVIAPNPTWTTLTGKPATFPPTLPILESDVTNLVSDLALKAPLASPVFTGNPTAPTATPGDNDTSIATTAFVTAAVGLVNIPPATVAPLMDGVAAVGVTTKYAREDHRHPSDTAKLDAASYTAADVLTKIKTVDGVGSGLDADLLDGASGAAYLDRANHTGTQAESTVTNLVTDLAAKAPLASPVFTGDPTAPTPLTADNDTSIATTAFVKAQGYATLASPVFTGNPTAPTPSAGDSDTSIATTAFVATSFAPLASPALTGNPTAPTPTVGDNDTSVATTAFVTAAVSAAGGALPSNANPIMNGVAAPGVAVTFSRADHVHPTDTSLAPLAGPVFTGDPRAPTPATADNDTSIATTAFVKAQAYAPLASPALTGNPTAPTPSAGDNDTSIATTAFVAASFAPLASPALTGNPTAPTATAGDNDTTIATTAFVTTADNLKANLASPTFTGNPLAPTPAAGDNDTSIATTAFVQAAVAAYIEEPKGRLSLVSDTPFYTTDQLAKTSIFWTLLNGNTYPWYNGTVWAMRTLASQLTLVLDATGHLANKNYDLFLYNDAGTDRLVAGPAWTNDTTRASAISLLNGFYVNTASMTARYNSTNVTVAASQGLYVGTFRASANGQTQMAFGGAGALGVEAYFGLWNRFNRVAILATLNDTNAAHSYTSATVRQLGGASSKFKVSFVRGLAEEPAFAQVSALVTVAVAGAFGILGIGLDDLTNYSGAKGRIMAVNAVNINVLVIGYDEEYVSPGFHFFAALENSDGVNNAAFNMLSNFGNFQVRYLG